MGLYAGIVVMSRLPRLIGFAAGILCSFTYLVTQIYGVGMMTFYFTGFAFEVFLSGMGGIWVCFFVGVMRAVIWTQVGQYIVLVLTQRAPKSWRSMHSSGSAL